VSKRSELNLTAEDHQKAFTEVSFLMEIFIHTIKDLVGGGTAGVARNAGRNMAKKLPIYLEKPLFGQAVDGVLEQMDQGFEIQARTQDKMATLEFGRCPIRDVCRNRNQEPGGELCQVFHGFLGGIVNEVYGKPVRTSKLEASTTRCQCRLEAA